jgi:hypothetical protein
VTVGINGRYSNLAPHEYKLTATHSTLNTEVQLMRESGTADGSRLW